MRISAAILGAFLGLRRQAAADDVPVSSRVEAVTVFLSGAEITRTARLGLDKGEHTLVLNDLPAEAVPGSIRVDGKATGGLDIESVDTRRRYIARADQEAVQAERKSLEDQIEKLRDDRGLVQGQEDAAQTRRRCSAISPSCPANARAAGAAVPPTDWQRS
jgi:hypothetical protein